MFLVLDEEALTKQKEERGIGTRLGIKRVNYTNFYHQFFGSVPRVKRSLRSPSGMLCFVIAFFYKYFVKKPRL
jgi:hypothetical protein